MSDLDLDNITYSPITSKDALAAVIAAQGNIELAAELSKVPKELIIATLVSDENNAQKLNQVLRTFSMLKLFSTMDELQLQVKDELASGQLKGRDVAKAFSDVATLLVSLTNAPAQTNINVFETAMRTLPPHVQTALQVLAGGKQDDAA